MQAPIYWFSLQCHLQMGWPGPNSEPAAPSEAMLEFLLPRWETDCNFPNDFYLCKGEKKNNMKKKKKKQGSGKGMANVQTPRSPASLEAYWVEENMGSRSGVQSGFSDLGVSGQHPTCDFHGSSSGWAMHQLKCSHETSTLRLTFITLMLSSSPCLIHFTYFYSYLETDNNINPSLLLETT